MKKLKKIMTGIVCVAMAAMMAAGCGSSSSSSKAAESVSDTTAETEKAAESTAANGDTMKIGIIQHMDHPSLNQIYSTIVETLQPLVDEGKVEIVYQNAAGDMTLLPSIIQDMISDGVDMLVPIATPTAQACQAATTDIPIVFSAVSNPVEAGLVTAFDQTTANITGVSNSIAIEDIFALAAELTPDVKTYGFVYNTSEVNSVTGIERAKAYCDANGIAYEEATVTGTADVAQAASSLAGSVDAFFTPNDNTVASAMPAYLEVANQAGIPIYVGADSMVTDGGLATVGIDYTVLGRQTGEMIEKIVNGAAIADTPVEQIAEYAKMINVDTAAALNITVTDAMKSEFVLIGEE